MNASKVCPFTGRACQHPETCSGRYAIKCWARDAHEQAQPESRETGRHRDSQG